MTGSKERQESRKKIKETAQEAVQNLEDLSIVGLVQSGNSGLSKAILDASWGKFENYVLYNFCQRNKNLPALAVESVENIFRGSRMKIEAAFIGIGV